MPLATPRSQLTLHGHGRVEALHGDKTQPERAEALARFKRGAGGGWHVMVATDVASRGLDIPSIKTVVCYDTAKRSEDHTHRIGRTGRAGAEDGTAYTLLTAREEDAAVDLVQSLLSARQAPAADLIALARRSRRWMASGLQKRLEAAGGGGGAGRPMAQPPETAPSAGDFSSVGRSSAEFAPPQLYPQHRPPQQHHPPVHAATHPPPAPPLHTGNDALAEARAKAQEMAAQLSACRAAALHHPAPNSAGPGNSAGHGCSAGHPLQPPPPPPSNAPAASAPHRRPSRWS